MLIQEFAIKFCQDLIDKRREERKLVDLGEFPYEVMIQDSLGDIVPAIIIDTVEVPIRDILTMERSDFIKFYTTPSAGDSYDRYLENLQIIEGDDVIMQIRNRLAAEYTRLSETRDLCIDV